MFFEMEKKLFARFKHLPEDFVVEEFLGKRVCEVSKKRDFLKKREFEVSGNKADYLWMDFEKYNIDHFHAMRFLARFLKKGFNEVGYAGIKDKFAWTCQRVSVYKPDLDLIKQFSHSKIFLKNFEWRKRRIRLGYLDGNRFRVVLRDLELNPLMRVVKRIKRAKFFPNFFGKQRFGYRENNFEIGILLLKGKFKEAVWKILCDDFKGESEEIRKARKRLLKEKNFGEAYDYFPKSLKLERELLFYLKKKEDYVSALRNCERKNVLLFVHSVQSRIFNELVEVGLRRGILKKGQKVPLVGYKTKYSGKEVNELLDSILKKYGISKESFRIREIPYLKVKGSFRKVFAEVAVLDVGVEDDDLFKGSKKVIIEFDLFKGSYASVFLEQFFDLVEN